jgi:hypothetical protein
MAVETLSGEFAAIVGPGHGLLGNVKTMFGRYDWGLTVVEDGDIRLLFKLPPKCLVVGGDMWAQEIDSASTGAIDIDIGWAANGGGSATYSPTGTTFTFTNAAASADAAGFVNSGALDADVITNLKADNIHWRPFPMITGPIYFSHETQVQAEVNAAATTPADGEMWVFLNYIQL